MHNYYIDIDGKKDGPHDLVTIMRRIRAGKISRDTGIYEGDAATFVPAQQVADIAIFFDAQVHSGAPEEKPLPTLDALLARGWEFLKEHNILTVYAGGLLLSCLLVAPLLIEHFGLAGGAMAAWAMAIIMHNLFLVFVLRIRRGQTTGPDFINRHLAPVLGTLVLSGLVLALMMAGGLVLLIIPGMIVAVIYIFAPLLIIDRRFGMTEGMYASRLLLQKHDRRYLGRVFSLVVFHLVCLVLIIPIPLSLPIFAHALCELYEDLTL